jgi:hypothetical protein
VSPFYLTTQKEYQQNILHEILLVPKREWPFTHVRARTCVNDYSSVGARSTAWSTTCLRSSKPIDYHGFKSWWAYGIIGKVGLNFESMQTRSWRETRSKYVCLASDSKGDPCYLRVSRIGGKQRHVLWGHLSLLLNCTVTPQNLKFWNVTINSLNFKMFSQWIKICL